MRALHCLFLVSILAFLSVEAFAQTYYSVQGNLSSSKAGACGQVSYTPDPYGGWCPNPGSSQVVGDWCRIFDDINGNLCLSTGITELSCGAGLFFDDLTGTCTACLEGEVYNPATNSCDAAPPDCPAGWDGDYIQIGTNPDDLYRCIPTPPPNCSGNEMGWVVNSEVCQEPFDDCLAIGGGYAQINGVEACIPQQDPEPPPYIPECSGSSVLTIDGSVYTCTSVYSEPEDLPDIGNPSEGKGGGDEGTASGGSGGGPPQKPRNDTDNDGIPNTEDDDIDGDGTPNGLDDDVDGDGTPNSSDDDIDGDGTKNQDDGDMDGDGKDNSADDDTDGDGINNDVDTDDDGDGVADGDDDSKTGADGEDGTATEESVKGGGNCAAQPSCSGKEPILCAILIQQWHTRCAQENPVSGGGSCDTSFTCEKEDAVQCAILKQQHEIKCSLTELDQDAIDTAIEGKDLASITGDDVDLQLELQAVYNQTGASASCPAPAQLSLSMVTLNIDYQLYCDLASSMRPLVLFLFGLAGFYIVLRAFG